MTEEEISALAQPTVQPLHELRRRTPVEVDRDVTAEHQVDLAVVERWRVDNEVVVTELDELAHLVAYDVAPGLGVQVEEPLPVQRVGHHERALGVMGLLGG